jgi:hypothetical protein
MRAMREQPRQIYTSVRGQPRAGGPQPSLVRNVVVTLLAVLTLAVLIVAILSLV